MRTFACLCLSGDVFRRGYWEEKTIRQMEEAFLRLADSLDMSHMAEAVLWMNNYD